MGKLDFYVDFNIEVPNIDNEFNILAEQELRDLASGHSDLVGAAVSLENIVEVTQPYRYQVRIVVYTRPEYIAAVQKDPDPMTALKDALDAIKKQVRAAREKMANAKPHRVDNVKTISYELSPEEVYATYASNQKPEELLQKGRTKIADNLMVKEGLNQEAAYFAADQILQVAERTASE